MALPLVSPKVLLKYSSKSRSSPMWPVMNVEPSLRLEPSSTGTCAARPVCSSLRGMSGTMTPSTEGAHCVVTRLSLCGRLQLP